MPDREKTKFSQTFIKKNININLHKKNKKNINQLKGKTNFINKLMKKIKIHFEPIK